jgi:hypothetical protein
MVGCDLIEKIYCKSLLSEKGFLLDFEQSVKKQPNGAHPKKEQEGFYKQEDLIFC